MIEDIRGALAQAREPFERSIVYGTVPRRVAIDRFIATPHGLSYVEITALEPGVLSEDSFTPFYPHEFYRFIGNLCASMGSARIEGTQMLLNPPKFDVPTLPILYRQSSDSVGEFLAIVGTWPESKTIYAVKIERDAELGKWKMVLSDEDRSDRFVIADRIAEQDLLGEARDGTPQVLAFIQTFRNTLDATNLRAVLVDNISLRYSTGLHKGPFARQLTKAEYYAEMKAMYDGLVAVDRDIYPPRTG